MSERAIPVEWIERTVASPGLRVRDPDDLEIERFYRRVPEFGDRVLKVVVNTRVVRWRVVSVYFERRMRGEVP